MYAHVSLVTIELERLKDALKSRAIWYAARNNNCCIRSTRRSCVFADLDPYWIAVDLLVVETPFVDRKNFVFGATRVFSSPARKLIVGGVVLSIIEAPVTDEVYRHGYELFSS